MHSPAKRRERIRFRNVSRLSGRFVKLVSLKICPVFYFWSWIENFYHVLLRHTSFSFSFFLSSLFSFFSRIHRSLFILRPPPPPPSLFLSSTEKKMVILIYSFACICVYMRMVRITINGIPLHTFDSQHITWKRWKIQNEIEWTHAHTDEIKVIYSMRKYRQKRSPYWTWKCCTAKNKNKLKCL